MPLALNIIIDFFVFLFGTVIASFLNVLVYRIPKRLDFVRGRSFCPNCNHALSAADLFPVLSYLMLKRRCRYCKEPISPRYMLVELLGGVLALLAFAAFFSLDPAAILLGYPTQITLLYANTAVLGNYAQVCAALVLFAAFSVLLTISLIDADTMEIPNGLNVALGLVGLASILTGPEISLLSRAIGIVAVSIPLLLITIVVPGAFGGGDVKLMAAAGLLLGWENLLVAFFIALVIAGVYGIIALASKSKTRKEHFAFGPALCIGISVALIAGHPIIDLYTSMLY